MFQIYRIRWNVLIFLLSIFLFNGHSYAIKTVFQGGWTGYTDEQIQYIAENNVAVVSDSGPNHIAEIKSYNPDLIALYYIKFIGMDDPPPEVQDILWLDDEGLPVRNLRFGWYLVDFRNPSWVDMLIDFLADKMEYYDGVMLDNTSILWLHGYTAIPGGYDEAEFYEALQTNVAAIKAAYPNKLISFNGYKTLTSEYSGLKILDYCDGIGFEEFTYRFDGSYIGKSDLIAKGLNFLAISKMKSVLEKGETEDYQRRMFVIGVYLLIANDYSTYRYAGTDGPGLQIYPEYQLNLGAPKGDPYEAFGGLIRHYEDGIVFVNPGTEAININIGSSVYQKLVFNGGGSWKDQGFLSWEAVTGEIEILPESGIILKE